MGLSIAGHLVVLLALAVNLSAWNFRANRPVRLAIDASVVIDQQAVREREEQARRRREAELKKQREEDARRKAEQAHLEAERKAAAEKKRQQELARRKAEQKKLQQKKAREKKAREEAERKKRAAAAAKKKQAEAAARKKREQAEAEKRRREEAARKARAAREAELQAQLAAEQRRDDAIHAGLLDQWVEVIRQKIQRNWIKPASLRPGLACELRVRQIPGGEVVDVQVGRCNGDAAVIRSIENAVYRSSPLPSPPDPSLFVRTLTIDFRPDD